MTRATKLLHMAIILVAGAIAYQCALKAGFLAIDDAGLIDGLVSAKFSVKRLLFSGSGEYFRPLPFITYAFDFFIAGARPAWYHGVNVGIHLMNGLLVYLLATNFPGEAEHKLYAALTAALVFVLAPVNTEAVMWVSARPDLLCTLFSLLSLNLVIQLEGTPKIRLLCFLFVAFLCSLMSKEVSVVLLAIVPVYLFSERGKEGFKSVLVVTAPFVLATLVWLSLRGSKKGVDPGIGKVLTGAANAVNNQHGHGTLGLDLFASYGFYLKKLIYPFPLNFAIFHIDKTMLILVAASLIPCAAVLFYHSRPSRLPLLLIFVGIVPPVAAYFAEIPWTPYAERYLYLPMVGFSLLVAHGLYRMPRVHRFLPLVLVAFFSFPTYHRVVLWTKPIAFWNDVVEKSPDFSRSYVGLATAQIEGHDYDAAEKNLYRARSMGYDHVPLWNNLAAVYYAKRDYARYEAAMSRLAAESAYSVEVYIKLIENLMRIPEQEADRRTIYNRVIEYHLEILKRHPSYYLSYYNIGKLYWVLGNKKNAVHYLELFLAKANNDPMRPFAKKILLKLTRTT